MHEAHPAPRLTDVENYRNDETEIDVTGNALMEDLLGILGRPLLMLVRFVLWLAWDLCLHSIPWWIGWPICRAVALGRFPHAGWNEYEESGFGESVIVCSVGLAILAGACAWLYPRFPVP